MNNPDHDSLFLRFEQLEDLLNLELMYSDHVRTGRSEFIQGALEVARLIRKQVLK